MVAPARALMSVDLPALNLPTSSTRRMFDEKYERSRINDSIGAISSESIIGSPVRARKNFRSRGRAFAKSSSFVTTSSIELLTFPSRFVAENCHGLSSRALRRHLHRRSRRPHLQNSLLSFLSVVSI